MANEYFTNPAIEIVPERAAGDRSFRVVSYGSGRIYDRFDSLEFVKALESATAGRPRAEIEACLREQTGADERRVEEIVDRLVAVDALIEDEDAVAARKRWIESKWHRSLFFHLSTTLDGGSSLEVDPDRDRITPREEEPSDDVLVLPDPGSLPDVDLGEAMLERRTCRNFDGSSMTLEELSDLLYHWVETSAERSDEPLARPSGFDVSDFPHGIALVAVRCEGIDPGVYRYHPTSHSLDPVSTDEMDRDEAESLVREMIVNQPWTEASAVTFFPTVDLATFRRTVPDSAAYPWLFTHVSAHAQRLILLATAYGHDVFQSAALQDDFVNDVVGVDGQDEHVAYAVSVGRRANGTDERPPEGGQRR